MENKILQEYIANDKNPLVLLTVEKGKSKDLVGHLVNYGPQKVWSPYKVGDELDFEPLHRCFPKYINTGYGKFGDIDKELKSKEGLLFLLADGMFPMGCGARFPNTLLAVKAGEKDPEEIAVQIYKDAGLEADVESRASGKFNLLENVLHVNGFNKGYFDDPRAYMDTIAGLTRSDIAPEGTHILFHAKLK